MAYRDPQLVHEDRTLTQISVGYTNDEFVGPLLFPAVGVSKQSDKYFVFPRTGWRPMDDIRAPGAFPNEIPPRTLSRESYFAQEHALRDYVPEEEQQNADEGIETLAASTEELTSMILQRREDLMQSIARTAANYATGHTVTLSGTAQWNDYTNSNPIADVKTGRDKVKKATGKTINTMVAGYEVASKLEDHDEFIERIKHAQIGVTTDQIISGLMNFNGRYVRASALTDTAALGQTESLGYIWGKDVVLAWVPERPGRRTPAYGYEFAWTLPNGQIMGTFRKFDDDRYANAITVRRRYDVKLVAVDGSGKSVAGYLIKNAIA